MYSIFPLMVAGGHFHSVRSLLWSPKMRTWLAMIAASVAALLIGLNPYAYFAIDLAAGALVVTKPAGTSQKCIAFLFGGMCMFHIGFIGGGQHGMDLYLAWNLAIGWAQWGILLGWGGHDVVRLAIRRGWLARRPVADRPHSGA